MTKNQLAIALQTMRQSLQADLEFNAKDYGSREVNDSCTVMPRAWPTRGVVQNWIEALQQAERLTAEPARKPVQLYLSSDDMYKITPEEAAKYFHECIFVLAEDVDAYPGELPENRGASHGG